MNLHHTPIPVALFMDGDNFNALGVTTVFQKVREWIPDAVLITKKVYGDFAEQAMLPWKDVCMDHNLQTIQCWRRYQKNSVDMKMACDIQDLIYMRPDIDTYILCTGDRDFIEVIQRVHYHGKRVVGLSTNLKGTSKSFQNECDLFEYIRVDGTPLEEKEKPLPSPPEPPVQAPASASALAPSKKGKTTTPPLESKTLPPPPAPKKVKVKAPPLPLPPLVSTPAKKNKKGLSPLPPTLPIQEIKPLSRSEKRQIRKQKKAKALGKADSEDEEADLLFNGILAREVLLMEESDDLSG